MIIGFDDVEIDFFFGACSEDEDGVPQGTFSPERIQDLYREARRLHFSSPRKDFLFIRGGAAAAPARLGFVNFYDFLFINFCHFHLSSLRLLTDD